MVSARADLMSRVFPEPPLKAAKEVHHFDRLPDLLLLLVFNKIVDVKALGRSYVILVDYVNSDDDSSSSTATSDKSYGPFSNLFRIFFGSIVKPLQALGQLRASSSSSSASSVSSGSSSSSSSLAVESKDDGEFHPAEVTHHSPTQVLKNFNKIRFLGIELPNGELGIDDGILVKWRADFGFTQN